MNRSKVAVQTDIKSKKWLCPMSLSIQIMVDTLNALNKVTDLIPGHERDNVTH